MLLPAIACLTFVVSLLSSVRASPYTYQGASESMIRGVFQSLLNGVGLWLVFFLAVVALVAGAFWLVNRLSRDTGLVGDTYRSVARESVKRQVGSLVVRALLRRR